MTTGKVTGQGPLLGASRRWSDDKSSPVLPSVPPSLASRASDSENLSNDIYLGSTSYSAVFTEGQSHIQLRDVGDSDDQEQAALAACHARLKFGLTPAKYQEGSEVLRLLTELETYEPVLKRWYRAQCLAALSPFLADCIGTVIESSSGMPLPKSSLVKHAEQVFINTSDEFVIQSTTKMEDLPAMFTGDSLRWDIVGLMLTVAGLSAIAMDFVDVDSENDKFRNVDWKDIARKFLRAGDQCITFCEAVDSLNDITVWLIMMNFILHTQVEGDADAICWRKQGGLVTAIFALGLHQEPKEPDRAPFFLKEMRRRTFWFAYICDKNFATFLGRPPMINSNFCYREMPLDLENADMALNGSELQRVLANLNADGWSGDKRTSQTAWLRASAICCKFREEILEISLGANTVDFYIRAQDILRRQESAYRAFPSYLRDRPDRWISERLTAENYFQISIHLDPIYNEFLLHRALVKRLHVGPTELIRVSRSVLSPLLTLCGQRHQQGVYANDLPWLIALYGLPPAGVLALELLQQLSDRSRAPDLDFPRSDVIQKLSVMISSIECIVVPTNGNYGICSQAKKMLQAILDIVLAPAAVPAHGPESVSNLGTVQPQEGMDMSKANYPTADPSPELSQMWFDNTNFDMDFWNNLEDHPLLAWPEVA